MIGNKVHTENLILAPDFLALGALVGVCLLATLALITGLILFRRYGWIKKDYLPSSYRNRAAEYSLAEYASKGSVVRPARRIHPNGEVVGEEQLQITAGEGQMVQEGPPEVGMVETAPVNNLAEEEFWDYDTQVDVEGFTASKLYEHLNKQGQTVLTGLTKQKLQAAALYKKISDENDGLKSIWVGKMGGSSAATAEDLEDYQNRKLELEEERERRKRVGADVGKILADTQKHRTDMDTLLEKVPG